MSLSHPPNKVPSLEQVKKKLELREALRERTRKQLEKAYSSLGIVSIMNITNNIYDNSNK